MLRVHSPDLLPCAVRAVVKPCKEKPSSILTTQWCIVRKMKKISDSIAYPMADGVPASADNGAIPMDVPSSPAGHVFLPCTPQSRPWTVH